MEDKEHREKFKVTCKREKENVNLFGHVWKRILDAFHEHLSKALHEVGRPKQRRIQVLPHKVMR